MSSEPFSRPPHMAAPVPAGERLTHYQWRRGVFELNSLGVLPDAVACMAFWVSDAASVQTLVGVVPADEAVFAAAIQMPLDTVAAGMRLLREHNLLTVLNDDGRQREHLVYQLAWPAHLCVELRAHAAPARAGAPTRLAGRPGARQVGVRRHLRLVRDT